MDSESILSESYYERPHYWISVRDRELPNYTYVFIVQWKKCSGENRYRIRIACRMNDAIIDDNGGDSIHPSKEEVITHWMHLPKPPKRIT